MTSCLSSIVTSSSSRANPATASVVRNRSGRPSSRAIRSILYGGYPSAAFATRASARSISSKPSRNGLDNDGTRAMISKSYNSDFVGPFRHPGLPEVHLDIPRRPALIWATGVERARRKETPGLGEHDSRNSQAGKLTGDHSPDSGALGGVESWSPSGFNDLQYSLFLRKQDRSAPR